MSQTILYYPTININNERWLKNAVLYWDKISSIVPFEEYDDYSQNVLYLKNEGLYEPIYPQTLFNSMYASEFIDTIIYRLENHKIDFVSENQYSKMHYKKLHPLFLEMLKENKNSPSKVIELINMVKNPNSDWIKIEQNVSSIYIKTLAEFSAKCSEENVVIGTDTHINQGELYMPYTENKSLCYSLNLNNCFPQPAENVGLEDIISFKTRYSDDLLCFKKVLRDFETKLSACCTQNEIRACEEDFKETWQREVIKLSKMFKGARLSFVWGSLFALISTASVVEPIYNMVAQIENPVVVNAILHGAAAVGVGHRYLDYKNKINRSSVDSGFSYLIRGINEGIINI